MLPTKPSLSYANVASRLLCVCELCLNYLCQSQPPASLKAKRLRFDFKQTIAIWFQANDFDFDFKQTITILTSRRRLRFWLKTIAIWLEANDCDLTWSKQLWFWDFNDTCDMHYVCDFDFKQTIAILTQDLIWAYGRHTVSCKQEGKKTFTIWEWGVPNNSRPCHDNHFLKENCTPKS